MGWNKAQEFEKAADELTHAEIVMIGTTCVGVIKVIPRTDDLHFHQMQILPEYQKGGIGSELIQRAINRSEMAQKPITLIVMKNTPAQRLYERFGFSVTNDFQYHCKMCRWPAPYNDDLLRDISRS